MEVKKKKKGRSSNLKMISDPRKDDPAPRHKTSGGSAEMPGQAAEAGPVGWEADLL